MNRKARAAAHRAEQIQDRAEYIQTLRNRIDELNAQRRPNKQQMAQLERSREQAETKFRQMYEITPEQAEIEVKRLESRAQNLGHLQEKLQEKISAFDEERTAFAVEYQKRKWLAATRPDKERIKEELARLSKAAGAGQSPKEALRRNKSERALDDMTKIRQPERRRERDYDRGR